MSPRKLSIPALTDAARRTASGSLPPAGADATPAPGPDGRERRQIRQRLRRTRRVRDARLAELGVLAAEMQARGRWNQALVDEWTSELEIAGRETRDLGDALHGARALSDLIAHGHLAQCASCGRLAGTADGYCTGCGRELTAGTNTIRLTPA
jgi:hypothetical protein